MTLKGTWFIDTNSKLMPICLIIDCENIGDVKVTAFSSDTILLCDLEDGALKRFPLRDPITIANVTKMEARSTYDSSGSWELLNPLELIHEEKVFISVEMGEPRTETLAEFRKPQIFFFEGEYEGTFKVHYSLYENKKTASFFKRCSLLVQANKLQIELIPRDSFSSSHFLLQILQK